MFPVVALLNDADLFFVVRIQETAKELGLPVIIASPHHGLEICEVEKPRLVILDLSAPGAIQAVRDLRSERKTRKIRIVGFYAHVNTALRDEALAAGVDEVLPQSAFTVRLSGILTDAGRA